MRNKGLVFLFHISYLGFHILFSITVAQKNPLQNFRSPLDTTLLLSATFGEPRLNHFHSGIDLKTFNREGLPVHAAADGFISRIKISATGYGKAIYITHPGSYLTVYAHLQKFNPAMDEFVKKKQYEKESFEVELFPEAKDFPVKKGEVIAFSGNSGGSTAPHLHFEVRDLKTEEPLNPLQFIHVHDSIQPVMDEIAIYLLNGLSPATPVKIKISRQENLFFISPDTLLIPAEKIGIAVNAWDKSDTGDSKNGIYSLQLKKDDSLIYAFTMGKFSFDETRYVNCHMDYREQKANDASFHRCFRQPANELSIYPAIKNKGEIDLLDNRLHNMDLTIKDFAGNTARINFKIQRGNWQEKYRYAYTAEDTSGARYIFLYAAANDLHTDEISLHFEPKTFYESFYFRYREKDTTAPGIFSAVHRIHDWFVPIHKFFSVSIKAKNLPENLKDKAVVVYRNEKGRIESKGGVFENGFIKTRARELGEFFVTADTTSPQILPQNIVDGKDMSTENEIKIKITDELSGIDFYRATVDGRWVLMEYDRKNNLLAHYFDEKIQPGEHWLELVVLDERKNKTVLKMRFRR